MTGTPDNTGSLQGWRLYVAMTRPGFLVITVVGCLIGFATAYACGCGFDVGRAMGTVVLATLAHASANVLNDYWDSRTGADEANTQGIFPFTGGARLIQRGLVSEENTRLWALVLLLVVVLGGLLLALKSGGGLVLLGILGLLLGWAYSSPPFALMNRGVGELAVALAWWLVVVGADYVQRGQLFVIPMFVAVGYAAMVANILLLNGLPDAASDAAVGKHTLASRLGHRGVAWVYLGIALAAHLWIAVGVALLIPPSSALWALVGLPFSALAAWMLLTSCRKPTDLRTPIVLTISATNLYGLGLAFGLALTGWA